MSSSTLGVVAGIGLAVMTGGASMVVMAGLACTVVGRVTGNKELSAFGGGMTTSGAVIGMGSALMGSASAAGSETAANATSNFGGDYSGAAAGADSTAATAATASSDPSMADLGQQGNLSGGLNSGALHSPALDTGPMASAGAPAATAPVPTGTVPDQFAVDGAQTGGPDVVSGAQQAPQSPWDTISQYSDKAWTGIKGVGSSLNSISNGAGMLVFGALSGMGKADEAEKNRQLQQQLIDQRAQQLAFGNTVPKYNFGVNAAPAKPIGIIGGAYVTQPRTA